MTNSHPKRLGPSREEGKQKKREGAVKKGEGPHCECQTQTWQGLLHFPGVDLRLVPPAPTQRCLQPE